MVCKNMATTVATPIPDKKQPGHWILKLSNGKIAFPQGFTVAPGKDYLVDIVVEKQNYAIVKLHKHDYTFEKDNEGKIIVKCKHCGHVLVRSDSASIIVNELRDHGLPVPTWVLEKYYEELRLGEITVDLREIIKPFISVIRKLVELKNEEEEIAYPNVEIRKTGWWVCEEWYSCVGDRDEEPDCVFRYRVKEKPKNSDNCAEETETIITPKNPSEIEPLIKAKEEEYWGTIRQLVAIFSMLRNSLRANDYVKLLNNVFDALVFDKTLNRKEVYKDVVKALRLSGE